MEVTPAWSFMCGESSDSHCYTREQMTHHWNMWYRLSCSSRRARGGRWACSWLRRWASARRRAVVRLNRRITIAFAFIHFLHLLYTFYVFFISSSNNIPFQLFNHLFLLICLLVFYSAVLESALLLFIPRLNSYIPVRCAIISYARSLLF